MMRVGLGGHASSARGQGGGIILRPKQAAVGEEVVGEDGGLQKAVVAVFAFVGAAATAAIVLEVADGGFDTGRPTRASRSWALTCDSCFDTPWTCGPNAIESSIVRRGFSEA